MTHPITFPTSPDPGDQFLADNGVTYIWTSNRWSASQAITSGQAGYTLEGGYSDFDYNPLIDGIVDGLGSNLSVPIVTLDLVNSQLNYDSDLGWLGYRVDGANIIEVGIIQALTSSNYTADGDSLYAAAIDWCTNNSDDPIIKYPLRTNNQYYSSPDCGANIETNISLNTLIQQQVRAYNDYQGPSHEYDIYAYARTSGTVSISNKVNWTGYFPCLVAGTLISLADGTQKKIEDVSYNDVLTVWNFDLGETSEARPLWVKRKQTANRYTLLKFSDGTELKTVGHHIFNKQAGEFTKIITDDTPVGTVTVNEHGQEITVISKEIVNDVIDFYNIWTQYHLNAYANGILTGNRYCNIYPIVDMKYVKDDRALRSVEEFAGIDSKYIAGLRLQEQTFDLPFIQTMVDRIESLDSMAVVTA
jgi:hypothetical protein